jgi:hypothetical protein
MTLSLGDITSGACESFGEDCSTGSVITPGAPVSTSYVGGDAAITSSLAPPVAAIAAPASSDGTLWLVAGLLIAGGLYYWFVMRKER